MIRYKKTSSRSRSKRPADDAAKPLWVTPSCSSPPSEGFKYVEFIILYRAARLAGSSSSEIAPAACLYADEIPAYLKEAWWIRCAIEMSYANQGPVINQNIEGKIRLLLRRETGKSSYGKEEIQMGSGLTDKEYAEGANRVYFCYRDGSLCEHMDEAREIAVSTIVIPYPEDYAGRYRTVWEFSSAMMLYAFGETGGLYDLRDV
ncbi:MAG: hypothetical protein LBO05_04080 [Deltaproteobacteria bacterium]|jgi:hypothetical protein|nr:hypothetical protein [Deltaproteobacteria bacterium]